jgi:hypothetical protein
MQKRSGLFGENTTSTRVYRTRELRLSEFVLRESVDEDLRLTLGQFDDTSKEISQRVTGANALLDEVVHGLNTLSAMGTESRVRLSPRRRPLRPNWIQLPMHIRLNCRPLRHHFLPFEFEAADRPLIQTTEVGLNEGCPLRSRQPLTQIF